jgi:hypothetical protein
LSFLKKDWPFLRFGQQRVQPQTTVVAKGEKKKDTEAVGPTRADKRIQQNTDVVGAPQAGPVLGGGDVKGASEAPGV